MSKAGQQGRPSIYDSPLVDAKVMIGEHHKALLKEIGDGNLSAGAREVLDFYIDQNDIDTDEN